MVCLAKQTSHDPPPPHYTWLGITREKLWATSSVMLQAGYVGGPQVFGTACVTWLGVGQEGGLGRELKQCRYWVVVRGEENVEPVQLSTERAGFCKPDPERAAP